MGKPNLVVICLKIRTFVVSATTLWKRRLFSFRLWFAWKFVPLWYQQQLVTSRPVMTRSCDLLENSYLCGISNNSGSEGSFASEVVICLKIRTFVVSATTVYCLILSVILLWFAWKFVPLWYQQQLRFKQLFLTFRCDLLENSYLCGISNNDKFFLWSYFPVVICLKIRTFVVSATTRCASLLVFYRLWFAWKFVPLWYQQQLCSCSPLIAACCDLLENSYLCGISNNY